MMPGQISVDAHVVGAEGAYAKERVMLKTAAFEECVDGGFGRAREFRGGRADVHDRAAGRHGAADARGEIPDRVDVDGVDVVQVVDRELEDGLEADDAGRVDERTGAFTLRR